MKAITRHPLVNSLIHAEGNPKACMYTEPLWGIPFNLYAPFASVYMLALGVTEQTIGLIATIGLALQMITSILGGPITDKLGRKRATFIFDTISWSIPRCSGPSRGSDVVLPRRDRELHAANHDDVVDVPVHRGRAEGPVVHFWTWVHIAGIVAGFVTPLAGLLIERFELIPMMRAIYLFAFVSMTAKFIILNVVPRRAGLGASARDSRSSSLAALVADLIRDIPRIFRSAGRSSWSCCSRCTRST